MDVDVVDHAVHTYIMLLLFWFLLFFFIFFLLLFIFIIVLLLCSLCCASVTEIDRLIEMERERAHEKERLIARA